MKKHAWSPRVNPRSILDGINEVNSDSSSSSHEAKCGLTGQKTQLEGLDAEVQAKSWRKMVVDIKDIQMVLRELSSIAEITKV